MANFFKVNKFQEDFHSDFNEETGISTVRFNNKYGKFVGTAKLNPADETSKFIGQHIAETRANIQYYKTVVRIMTERWDILRAALRQEPNSKVLKGMVKDANNKRIKAYKDLFDEQAYLDTYIINKFGQK